MRTEKETEKPAEGEEVEPDEDDEEKEEELGTVLKLRELATGERDRHRVREGVRLCRERRRFWR